MRITVVLLVLFAGACGDDKSASPDAGGPADGQVPAIDAPGPPADVLELPDANPIDAGPCAQWTQWGGSSTHAGQTCVTGQPMTTVLGTFVMDPFVLQEEGDAFGELLLHYQVPLIVGDDVYMEFLAGSYTPCVIANGGVTCDPNRWSSIVFTEKRLHWENGQLVEKWHFDSDWIPEPSGGFAPLFQPAIAGDVLWVPGRGGTVYMVDRESGVPLAQLNPLGDTVDPNSYVAGPITVDAHDNIYYNVLTLDTTQDPFDIYANDSGKLVRISGEGTIDTVSYKDVVIGAPADDDLCVTSFSPELVQTPWPPADQPDGTPTLPGSVPCRQQRPGINTAPAVGPDGTIYIVSRAVIDRYAFLTALDPDLTPRWSASLRDRLTDGCGVLIPDDGDQNRNDCRPGARPGVDPATNQLPAGRVIDESSSSPVVLPNGGVAYGSYTSFNGSRGHLMAFDSEGMFTGAYDFGWDSTPAVWAHDGAYSIVTKDNHYGLDHDGFPSGPYYITQLDPDLVPEWQFKNTNVFTCPDSDPQHCTADHPNGFEWCINAPVVDAQGSIYANSEDGNLYEIAQGGQAKHMLFLSMAIGAAYTPLALDRNGNVYTLNGGKMTVAGGAP